MLTKQRIVVVTCALIASVLGAVFGALAAPTAERFTATVNVAMLPGPDLTTAESSSFWEVLNNGQITRLAAVVYDDAQWLTSAAEAANVRQSELTLTASALPSTTIVAVTVTANSSAAAEAALSDVLTTSAPQVANVTAPFLAKQLSPTEGSAYLVPIPDRAQFMAAGALAGLLAGGSIGWFYQKRRRRAPQQLDNRSDDNVDVDEHDVDEHTARHSRS